MYLAIAEFLFSPFFFGFTIWSFVFFLAKKESIAGYQADKIDDFVVGGVIFLGIVHILFLITHAWTDGIDVDHALGEHLFGFWIYPITYSGLTQLLWFKRIRKEKIVRLIMAGWIFIVVYLEKFLLLITSFHSDFFTDNGNYHSLKLLGYLVVNMVIAFLIFATMVVAGLEIKASIRNKPKSS
jgi:hypothetical protein